MKLHQTSTGTEDCKPGHDCPQRWFSWGAGIKSRKSPETHKQFVRFKKQEFPKR